MGTLVALAVMLALGCDSVSGAVDAGGDADSRDYGVVVYDVSTPRDMGEPCESELPCVQRWRIAGGACFEQIQDNFPCDDGNERTYDDRCDDVGACDGIACECDVVAGCCDGCTWLPIGAACTTAPPFNNPASCVHQGTGRICSGPPVTP